MRLEAAGDLLDLTSILSSIGCDFHIQPNLPNLHSTTPRLHTHFPSTKLFSVTRPLIYYNYDACNTTFSRSHLSCDRGESCT